MGVLRKLQTAEKNCNKKPLEVHNYQSKFTYLETEAAVQEEILLDATGAALVAGSVLSFGGTVQNYGCQAILVEAMNHFISAGQCDECLPDTMETKTVSYIVPPGHEVDLGPGHFSSVLVTTGTEDATGVFAPAAIPVGAPEQVIRFNSCFSEDCCGAPVVPA